MTLKGLHGLERFKEAGLLIGMLAAVLLVAFAYAEMTSFGSYPQSTTGTPAPSPNNIFIHGWSDYNLALLNLTDTFIKNNSYDNYTCNATMCTWYAYLDNDNYTKQRGTMFVANFSKSNVYFNDSEGVWRNVSDLSASQGVWNYSSAAASYTADADTVLLLKFDETNGPYVNDSSAFKNNGTIYGANRTVNEITNSTNCVIGNCLMFDGKTNYVNVTDSSSLTTNYNTFTVEAWVKLNQIKNYEGIATKTGPGEVNNGWQLTTHTSKFRFVNWGNVNSLLSSTAPSTGVWYHVAGVQEGTGTGQLKLYVNGVLEAVGNGSAYTTTANIIIGREYATFDDYYFNGTIDEVKIVNRSLTADEIRAEYYKRWNTTTINYELAGGDGYDSGIRDVQPAGSYWLDGSGNSLDTGLVGYWKFSEGSGATTADASGYGNTGTLTNMNTSNPGGGNKNDTSGWNNTGCKYGSCLTFDRVNDEVIIANTASLNLSSAVTLSGWINYKGYLTEINGRIVGKSVNNYDLWVNQNNKLTFRLYALNGGFNDTDSPSAIPANVWTHVAGTYDGSIQKLYVNGILVTNLTWSSALKMDTLPVVIGSANNLRWFNGTIDEVRIYNRAITPDEVKRLFDSSAVKLKNDFTTVAQSAYLQMNMTNYTGGTLFNTPAEEIKVDGNPISNIYTPANGSHTTYFYDWKQNDWTVWAKEQYGKGLVGWWKFDEGIGATTNDWSGKNNIGTLTNMNTSNPGGGNGNSTSGWNASGRFGNALLFDGANDYVDASASSNLNITDKITVSAWIKPVGWGSGGGYGHIIAKSSDTAVTNGFSFYILNDGTETNSLKFYANGGGITLSAVNSTNLNQWQYVAVTYDRTTLKLYVNGIAVNSTSETDALTLTTASALIGARISGSYHFNGAIDDVKIWNRSLSSEEIRLEYENKIKQGAPDFNDPRFREQFRWKDEFKRDTYPGINITYAMTAQDPFVRTMVDANATGEYGPGEGVVGVWHFNEGSGTTAYDQSGYANTGTLTNMNTSNPGGGNGNWTSGWNASGRFGNALRFDGVNDYVNASKATQLGFTSGDFSMSFWINVPTGAPTDRGLMGRGTDTTDGWFVYYSGTPDIQFYTVQSGAQQAVTSSTWTTFDTWHHIAITRTGATGKIFKDGVQIGTASLFVDPIYNANRDFFIGGKSTELTNGGKATIDEVMIFNRSLSATEIKKIYEGRHNISIPLKFTEPKNTLDNGLILYAPLEEGSGTTTYDYSGYNNTGTLTNMNTSNPAGWNGNGTSGWNTTHTKFGTSLVFDGVNDFVQVSDSAAINFTNSSFTLAAWAKTGVSQAGNVHLVGRGINAGYSCQRHYGLMFSNTFYGEVGNCTGASNFGDTQSVAATSTYTDNIWHFGTFVFNVTHLMLYVDGAQAATPVAYTLKNGVGWGSSVMLFGKSISHGVTFNGSIDEIRVYNRSLSPEEISQLFYIGQTKMKAGNYYYRNTSSESVLWTAQNFKETYRGAPSQALGSLFSVWSNATAKTATYNYDFNSTLNQHFLFSQGYTNSINAAWFNPSNVSLGFSSETLESFDNSTQVLAREETDAAGAALNCDAYSDGKDNYLCSDNNGKTYNVKWKHFYELDGSEEVITLDPETLKTEWDKPTAYTHYNYTGKLYRWLGDGIDLLVTPTHKVYGKADYGLSGPPNNTECSSDVLNTLTTDCDLNALSLDQIGQPSFNDNAKKSVSSGSGEISFASDRNSLYPSSGADLTKTSISPNTTSNSFLDKFDFSFKQNDGVYKSKILKSDINFLVPEFLLKNENNTFVSATSFIHTSPAFLSLLNLPLFKSLPSSMHSCPVSSLLANILPSLCSNTALATSALASVSMPLTTSLLSPDSNFGILTTISANPINLCNRTTDNVFIPCDSGIPLNPEELSLTESLKLNGTPVIMLNASLDAQKATPTLEDYSGMVYDVTVKNHIILVKRNNKTAWSGNSVVNSSLSYYDLQDNDLVLWLKMNDGWGSLNASDASGWGNNGVLTNMNVTGNSTSGWNNTHCKTGFGMCMNFDGVNDYVDVGTEASLNVTGNQLTLAAWVRPVGTGNNMIISKYNDVAVAGGWDLNIKGNTNQIRFLTFTPSGEVDITTVSAIPLNAWSYVVAVYDGTNYAIYINGTSQSYTGNTFTGTINGTWRPVRVGSRHEHPQYVFNGSIDDVKIWRRALSGDEIKSIYESQAEEYPNYFKVDKTSAVQHSKTVSQKYDGSLVGYWKFDEGANTSAGDSSGMGNTGTLTNMNTSNPAGWNGNGTSGWNTTHAKFGNALVFDGVNDYVNISDSASLDITQAITLEAWFKTDSLGKFHTLISKGADDAYNLRVRDTNVTQFYLNASDGTSINAQSTNTISANTWYHIVGTYDGSTAKLYVNAAEWASASATKTINTNNVSLWIGERTDSWASGWTNGIIDDVKIYSRALSPDEVKQHYLQTQSQYYDDFNTQPSAYVGVEDSPDNGLVGYWKFDEASGTSAKDESGLGNTGTWTGTANVTWNASGKFGNAMSFDGVDDYVNVASGTTLDLPANFTFSAWINRNSGADQTIINRAGDRYIWQINTTGINAGINLYLRGGWRASGVLIPTGAWKHLTTVFDGKNTLFYVDGVLQATVATSGSYTTGSVINQIGVQNAVNFFNGTIDEVKIWNRSLSSTEIYNDYIAKNAYFNKRNATANSVAHTIKTIGNQTTIDYNLTDHDSAGQYDYDQRLLKIEGRAGDANPHLNITTHPVTYSPSVATWFNISVEPCAQWCNVTLEANFSGVVANYTLSRGIKNEYYTSLTTPAGITQYRYYVRTSDENWRVTDQYTITPAKATPILGLKQNNSFATGSGLVGYWSFDENTSTVAYDSSGYNNDGTLTGNAKFNTSGRFGNAMFFDGVNANVTVNPSPSLNVSQGLTLMAWIKPDLVGGTGAGSYHTIACKGDAPGQTAAENYCLFIRDDELFFQTNDGSGYASFNTSNVNFAANTWYHVAAAINQSTNLTLFVDGVYRDGTVLSKPITGNPYNLTIGVHRNGWIQTQHFYGLVDEVRIYNYSMSAQEITDSMNATIRDLPITYANATNVTGFARLGDAVNGVELTRNGSYAAYTNDSTLMGWWHFDNDHAADYSGWGNDGTVAGAVNTTGKLRGALQFDGVNDRVNAGAGTNSQVTNQNTIVFWMKGATVEVGDVAVGYGNVYEIGPYFTNTNLRIMINTPKSGLAAIYPGFTITPNAWQQIAVSYDSTTNTTKWYNNGALGGTDTTTFGGAIQLGSEILYFGFGGNANDYYNGTIDDVKIYNRTLTNREIELEYLRGKGEHDELSAAGIYQYNVTYQESQNFTAKNISGVLRLNQGVLSGNLYINGSQANANYVYGQIANATATIGTRVNNEGTLYLLRNGTEVGIRNGANFAMNETLFGASLYNFTAGWVGYNYTFTNITYALTIAKATPVLIISNGTSSLNTSNLVGYWRFESQGSAIDSSGNGKTGTLSTPPPTATEGLFGRALSFIGKDDNSVSLPANLLYGTSGAVSLWLNTRNYTDNSGDKGMLFTGEGGTLDFQLLFVNNTGKVGFNAWTVGIDSGNYIVSNGTWHHVVGTYGDFGVKLYIDSVQVGSSGTTTAAASNANGFYIGRKRTGYMFNGTIDEVVLFNRSLTADEVQMLYQSTAVYGDKTLMMQQPNKGARDADSNLNTLTYRNQTLIQNDTDLVGYWNLDEGTGNVSYDKSGHGNTGTLTNMNTSNPNGLTSNATSGWNASGRFGYGLKFDGVNDYVDISALRINGFSNFTYSVWVYPLSNSNEARIIDFTGGRATLDINLGAGSKLTFSVRNSTTTTIMPIALPPTNAWTYLAATYDNSTMRIYVNGNLTANAEHRGAVDDPGCCYATTIGGTTGYWNGTIDEVRIYNRSLTAQEIIELYNQTRPAGYEYYLVNTTGNANYTAQEFLLPLNITPGVITANLYINGTQADTSWVYGQPTNATINVSWARYNNEGAVSLLRNNTPVGSAIIANFRIEELAFLGAGLYNYTLNGTGLQNYSFTSNITYNVGIAQAKPVLVISNGTASINTSGLVGYWRFEQSSGSAATNDSSGYGNMGTLTDMNLTGNASSGLTQGRFGNALNFDGVDDYVNVTGNPSLSLGQIFTMSAWIYEKVRGNPKTFISKDVANVAPYRSYHMDSNNGDLRVNMGTTDNVWNVFSSGWTIPLNTWTHVIGTYDGSYVRIYSNGVLRYTSALFTKTIEYNAAKPLFIGSSGPESSGAGQQFNGTIDEVQIWNRSLTANEINLLYQSHAVYGNTTLMLQLPNKGVRDADSNLNTLTYRNQTIIQNDTGLVAYWNLDEGLGTSAFDNSGYGNTGTLTNMNTSNPNGLTSNATSGWNESGRFGATLKFDGVNDNISVGKRLIPPLASKTFGAWVKTDKNDGLIVGQGSISDDDYPEFGLVVNLTGFATFVTLKSGGNSGYNYTVGTTTITDNIWHHVAGVFDNESAQTRIYVDGILEGSISAIDVHTGGNNAVHMGGWVKGGDEHSFRGLIDEVRIYNRSLTAQEIIELYNQTRPAGYEYYLVNTTGNANYTSQEFLLPLNISRATPSLYAGFNASSGIPYGEPALVYGNTSNQEVQTDATLAIYLNGTSVKSGTGNQTLGLVMWAGISEFNLTSSATANYTGSSLNGTAFTVSKSTPILALSQNNSFPTGSGLVGYWSFDENTSATAYDSSGKNNDGTLTSMGTGISATSGRNTTNCKFGNCLVLDGTNDYVNVGDAGSLDVSKELTVTAWIRRIGITSPILDKGSAYSLTIRPGNPDIQFTAYNGSDWEGCQPVQTVPANEWHFIAGTYSIPNSQVKVYYDGSLVNTCSLTSTFNSITNDGNSLTIGLQDGVTYFNGSIDEVRIYNYSMTQAEIQASMNATIRDLPITYANATNVTGFIRLGDNSTSLILDRNGTITGGGHSVVSENKTLLGAGIYSYNLTYRESQNYTAKNITRILSIPKAAAPTLTLYVNGTQASTFWVYGQPTNATLTKTATFLNEGLLRLLRNGTSVGAGGPDNISELMLFGAGIFNYSAIFGDVQGNYTNTSILSNRDVTISQAKPVLIISNGTAAINTSGLIGYWRFEQSNGSAATNDSSGYGNMGTLTNMNLTGNSTSGLTQGRFGNALQLDGLDDYMDASNSYDVLGGPVSISAWIKPNEIASSGAIVSIAAATNQYANLYKLEDEIGWRTPVSGDRQMTNSNPLTANSWYHVVLVKPGGGSTLVHVYINGVNDTTRTPQTSDSPPNTANKALVGRVMTADVSMIFNGTIDEVQIWNRSLTADEINLLYQSHAVYGNTTLFTQLPNKGARDADSNLNTLTYRNQTLIQNDTGLVGYWRFENLTEDYSGYANNGNMTGNNATYNASGRFGSSLSFDGTNDFVGVQNSPSIGHNFTNLTITYWANPTNMIIGGGADIYPIGKKSGNYGFYIDIAAPAKPRLAIFNGTDGTDLVWTNTNQQNNTWQFIAFTITKSGSDLIGNAYFNGVLESTRTQSNFNQIANPDIPMTIGASIGSGYYEGGLDEIRMYNRTLGATEITELYNQTRPAGYEYYLLNTTGNANYTAQEFLLPLNITQAVLTGNLYINRTQASQTWKYPNATNATATTGSRINNEGTLYLLRNGTNVGILSGSNFAMNESLLVASIYNYTAAWVGSNYTFTNITYAMTIDKGVTVMTITSSDNPQTYPNTYVIYGAETSSGDADVLYTLLRNGTGVASAYNAGSAIQDTERTGAGPWNYTFVSDAGENYTANSTGITLIQTVNQGTPIINIYLNGSYATGNNTNLTYPNATIVNATYVRFLGNANATLFRNNTMITAAQNENLTLSASFWNYTAWWAGDENYTANATQLNLTILKGSLAFNLYINGTEGSVTYTYPNGTNATATIGTRINNEGAFSLLRNGTPAGILVNANLAMNESILAAGIYNFSANASGFFNYTITDILSGRILTISRGNPNIALFLNGSQADVSSYVYGNPTNATAYRTSILYNNEGTLQLWRNGTSIGSGGPGNISEILVLPAGIFNYSAILLGIANYTYSNISYVMTIQKATPILGIATNNTNGSGINSGVVLYLSFDENASSTAYDQSGFGNDATWTGGANNVTRNLTGRFGNALTFDGVNDFVFVSSVPRIISNQSFTAEAWAYPNNITVNAAVLSNSTSQILQIGASNRWQFLDCISPGFTASVSAWTHLAGVYDSTNNTCYLYGDGVLRNATSMSNEMTATKLTIGTKNNAAYFNGTIDEVKIYNYSRSAEEINASARGVWNDIPLQYHAIVNTTGFIRLGDSSAAINLTRNGTRISNGTGAIALNESVLFGAGIYEYNVTYQESQNFTAKNISKILNIIKAPTFATVWFNESNADRNYNRSETINATGFISTPQGFFPWETKLLNLTLNYTGLRSANFTDIGVITGANNTIYNITRNDVPNAYNFTLWFDGDENYSASFATRIASVYGNLWIGLNNPLQVYYAMNENVTLNVTVRDFLRGDEIPSVNVSMNLTSFWANSFKNAPYYSRNVSMLNFVGGNYSGKYNVTDLHAGNYSLNYTAARDFYRVGRNFTIIYINESANANISSLFVNVSANVTQNQAVLVNGSIDRIGNIEVNGTIDITIRKINPDNVGLVVANASALDTYETIYNSTLVDTGYNVTLVDDDTVNANTWTPSLFNVIVWGEASYDNFFMQYVDDNIWSQVVAGKPLVMTYYGMIKGAVDLNLSTGWGGRFARDVNVKTPHSVTGNYTAINVSEIQDATYNSLFLFDFRGTELADDGTSGRTVIGVNDTNGGRIVVYGPYRANHWTAEAEDIFLRSVYWAIYGTAQTTFAQTQNITVPYTFEDYFNESDGTAEGWNATIGSWIVQNGAYVQTANATANTGAIAKLKNNSYWSDYTVSMRFSMLGGVANNTQIYFRYDGSARYYLLNISSNGEFAFYKNTGSGAENITDASANLITINQDTWYTLNITARENKLDAEIGGLGRINTTDASGTIAGGTIALGTHRSSSRFDNVAIYHHDGGNKRGTHYFKREWPVGTQSPGSYRATATFTYYNTTGNRTILTSSVDFNVTSNLTAQVNITLNSTLLSSKQALAINGNITAGGNLAVTGNFTLSVWNLTHEITNIQNTSRSVTTSSLYTISETWNNYYNVSGNYSVRANYTWNGGSDSQLANFTISYNVSADVNVSVNAPKFNASTNATVNVTVNNPMQVTITTLTIACNVNDYNGLLVASATTNPDIGNRTIGSINAGAVKWNSTQWNVSANNAGTYSVRCNVSDASGVIGFDVRSFDITRLNATLSINANRTGANYTANDAVGVQGNVTAVGGINASGRLAVEVYNASQRIAQVYSASAITGGLNALNITALNIAFLTYRNLTGVYTLNATFNYTNETGSEIVRSSTTQFNISSTTNATLTSTANKASYTTTETATVTTVITSLSNEAITNGNLTVYIFNSTISNATYRQYWNSSLSSIAAGGSATQTDTVNLTSFLPGTQYIVANFTFGGQTVNVTSTFTISVIVPTTNLTVKFFVGDATNYMVYTTASGEVTANRTNASSEWGSRWVVSYFNDSVLGLYGTGGGITVSASNTTTEHQINVNGMIRESRIYAIVTQGTRASFQNRAELLDESKFTTQINPSFGYPLREKNILSLKLKYDDIDVQGSETLRKGTYRLRIENNGTSGGKTLIHIKTI